MANKVVLDVAGIRLEMSASTENLEQSLRRAAETLNERYSQLNEKFGSLPATDRMAYQMLELEVRRLSLQSRLKAVEEEISELSRETSSCLSKL